MSNVYNLEPPTKGKVVVTTTHGDIDIELWAKEAPKACRNFVQLCMEGYYDGTMFHRIIPGFMIQGGDPTGTGTGGESIYGGTFKDEFHSRLRFSHRGIVAMANPNEKDANASQFFITLDKCDWLDRKHTIFGKVTGDTLYNVMDMGKLETNEEDRPVEVIPKIVNVEILWNPFEDIEPREKIVKVEVKKVKRKEKKNLNLLSFGNEAEEDEQELDKVDAPKIKSSHDSLTDARLLQAGTKEADEILGREEEEWVKKRESLKDRINMVKEGITSKPKQTSTEVEDDVDFGDDEPALDSGFEEKMRAKIMAKRQKMGDLKASASALPTEADLEARAVASRQQREQSRAEAKGGDSDQDQPSKPPLEMSKREKKAQKEYNRLSRIGATKLAKTTVAAHIDGNLMTEGERQRREIREKKKLTGGREKDTLARLAAFQAKFALLADKPPEPKQADDDDGGEGEGEGEPAKRRRGAAGIAKFASEGLYYADDDLAEGDAADWMSHTLAFEKDSRNPGSYTPGADDYVVVDPLLEKGKGKFSKEEQKRKKQQNAWAGGSRT